MGEATNIYFTCLNHLDQDKLCETMEEASAATDLGVCCRPDCGVVLQKRRECPVCQKMKIQGSFFCSQECYKTFWPKHKKIHQSQGSTSEQKASESSAGGTSGTSDANAQEAKVIRLDPGDAEISLVTLMTPYDLKNYGNYGQELQELKTDLGWKSVGEIKFYPKTGCQWYFFGYYDRGAKKRKERVNKAVSVAAGVDVYGSCLIMPSGPIGCESYYNGVKIKFVDLAESLAFYRDNDPRLVFQEREAARATGPGLLAAGFGMGGQACYVGGQPLFKTNATKGNSSMYFNSQY